MIRQKGRNYTPHYKKEVDSEGTWAISYGDLVTLLLTFFVLFFNADKVQKDKKNRLEITTEQKQGISSTSGYEAIPSLATMNKDITSQISGKIHQEKDYLLVEFPGVSFFKFSQTDLTKKGKESLKVFLKAFKPYIEHYQVEIRAFTDTKKVRNRSLRFKDNLELSALRSVTTMRFINTNGIPMKNIKVGGFGELKISDEQIQKLTQVDKGLKRPALDLSRTIILIIEPLVHQEASHENK